ncbi:tryptophan 2,3-dioxygenase family protein [Lacibacter sediminis]|uniref:Tryptophan 2,3-dioxygenase n=1 Tax=Lacibacter sediminis TaxID=2760713 RepID=A0A7G5XBG9_9BACT|nr:tryptophan 2,3-dioxygenase family protein [Lacibacter sediminis]QNA42822.1 tryptophan 2,3-dioxygenase [Lacibacter sediminis]
MKPDNGQYYPSYLQLEKILDSQHLLSFAEGQQPAHDEMLFIIIHQSYELWFKQILFELDFVKKVFSKEKVDDNSEDLNLCRHRLKRVTRILELLNQQVTILDTMTPMDFLEFRNLLTPASGFQSKQFRLIEATLGLKMEKRHQHDYYKRTNEGGFAQNDFNEINSIEGSQTVLQLINQWLERMPFFDEKFWKGYAVLHPPTELHAFWNDYRNIYQSSLTEREQHKLADFDTQFIQEKQADGSFSDAAMRSALFIMLYRDFPVFQTSFQILDTLIEIDHWLAGWRHKHYVMVRRMIGMRVGTGNTSGAGYLEGAVQQHYIFKDLAALSTYLIERRKLPKLPDELIKALGFIS